MGFQQPRKVRRRRQVQMDTAFHQDRKSVV